MSEKTVCLSEPVTVGGQSVCEVVVRASTVGDEEDAMQMAIGMKKGKNPVTVEMCLIAKVTKIPYDALRSMHGADYTALRLALNEANGVAESADGDDGENPTTPKSA